MESTRIVARGLAASPGRATGKIGLTTAHVRAFVAAGEPAVLIRNDTSPEDVPGIEASSAVVTSTGGLTGDAAIVARALGKPCVAGCRGVHVDYAADEVRIAPDWAADPSGETLVLRVGDIVTVDGAAGTLASG